MGAALALKASSNSSRANMRFRKTPACATSSAPSSKAGWCTGVTIPEGLTSEQIVARLTDNEIFAGSVREVPRGRCCRRPTNSREGTTREQVIQRMQLTQKRVLAEIWERRNPDVPVKSRNNW
jgi:UPF0755 protein